MKKFPTSPNRLDALQTVLNYKNWANRITFQVVSGLPAEEVTKQRTTRFGSIVHTLNHVWVVEDIFRHHLEGRSHGYVIRNTAQPPDLVDLQRRVLVMDAWWNDYVASMDENDLDRLVHFEFVGGGEGQMTAAEIVTHLVNHATYHRGFVADMLYQAGVEPASTDYSVFVRDVVRWATREVAA